MPNTMIDVQQPDNEGEAPYLATLNEPQREAVETLDGPVLVLAGAGTGKTRVLTTRMAHLLVLGRARPWEMLAVTFTNKAAREMRERVAGLVGHEIEGWWVGTFHALGARILRSHAEAVGLKGNFTIIDTDDQVRLVKQLAEGFEIDDKRWPARTLASILKRWKDRALTPDVVGTAADSDAADGRMVDLYRAYQDRLKTLNAADFGDLLLHPITLFQQSPAVLQHFQSKFRYLLVDEYQDTNVAQYLWLRLLAQQHRNICCVGDDDQSIYSWRGAEVGNILRFESDFPGATVIRLERNYRSTPHILGAASGLIAHNEMRLGKTLWTDINGGEAVRIRGVWDGTEEARVVGEDIKALHAGQCALNDMAILVRTGFQTREFEDRMITLGLPYRVVGGLRFYERQEIRDAVAYLRVVAQPDDDLAFERIINVPKRGIGDTSVQTLYRTARAENLSLHATASRLLDTDAFKPCVRSAIAQLLEDFGCWRQITRDTHHSEVAQKVLDESGYIGMWQDKVRSDRSPDAAGRLENLHELIVALGNFESLDAFLEHISLVMENEADDKDDKITLMTLHGVKGLEFDTVFLAGWEEGLFPHQRALDEGGTAALEEERRLAYVGITRAKRRALISFAANRRLYNKWQSAIPSRFIDELPAEHVHVETRPGLYGGDARTSGGSGFDYSLPYAGYRNRTPRHDPIRDGGSWPVGERVAPNKPRHAGERIFHHKFGYGTIREVEDSKLEIAFEKAGTKKVMARFVEDA